MTPANQPLKASREYQKPGGKTFGKTFLMRLLPFVFLSLALMALFAERIHMRNEPLPGGEPYLYARLAHSFHQRGVITSDRLVVGGARAPFTPYNVIAILASFALNDIDVIDGVAVIVSSIILAVISLFALDRLLQQLGRPPFERSLTLCILVLTPAFLHDSTITGSRMAILALQLSSATLLFDRRWVSRAGGVAAALLASAFSPLSGLASVVLGAILLFGNPRAWQWMTALVIAAIVGSSLIPLNFGIQSGSLPGFSGTLADLGARDGLPTFTMLLGAIGLWLLWPQKAVVAGIIALVLGAFVDARLLSGANVALACLSSGAISLLLSRSWRIKDLKYFALLVITCGILFSAVSAGVRISQVGPSTALRESLSWLRSHSRSGEVVFSSPSNSHWIQYFAGRPTVLDERITDGRIDKGMAVLQTYNLNAAEDYLQSVNATYILISSDMISGGVWDQPGVGLHYLLTNRETFKSIYAAGGIEIYEYLHQPVPKRP